MVIDVEVGPGAAGRGSELGEYEDIVGVLPTNGLAEVLGLVGVVNLEEAPPGTKG
jgi:hypothetical protein